MNSHCKGQFLMLFSDMNDWNMPVNISILLIDNFCWLLNDKTLKWLHFMSLLFKSYCGVDGLK